MSSRTDPWSGRLASALEAAGDAAYCWDLDSDRIEWAGRIAKAELDLMSQTASGRALTSRIHPEDVAQRQSKLAAHFERADAFDCEYRLRDAGGGFIWVSERGRVERDNSERPRLMLGVIRPVSDRRAEQSRLEKLANYDELTGHFNKTRLREAVDRIIAAGQRNPTSAAFLAIGIDGMAAINAEHGRDTADAVLIEVGRRLDRCLRVNDVIGRLDGDRFGILLAPCPTEHVHVAVGKVAGAVKGMPVITPQALVEVTVSIGSISFPAHGMTSYDVMTRAETALTEAKRGGAGSHLHHHGSVAPQLVSSASVGDIVQTALREGRVALAFQPVVSVATGEIDYYECLLRLRDDSGHTIAAGEFVPSLEQLGMIRLIDHYVLDRTIEELLQSDGVRLGLNVSGLTAADRPWLRALVSQLRHRPDLADRLVVEITETAALYDIEESVRFVAALREAGCRVALDDFGAGHTSMRHLQRLAVDTVKIDGSLIRNLTTNAETRVFLRHLLGLAEGFGFQTVAECIETPEQADILRSEGVGFLQGYRFGVPSLHRPWLTTADAAPLGTAD